jgi:UDP-hydrolysing UDP-N-acetyl-D-glucosamine 2-epimerase
MHEIAADPKLSLQIVVTGAHLEPRFGKTLTEIEADGFTVDSNIYLEIEDDSPLTAARATGRAVSGLAEAYAHLRPDIVVLLGDRYETLAAAIAALLLLVPIAHIHGGEITEGALDDAMRHAITKMAHLHFATAEPHRRRIVQMGESPDRVFTVGALGAEAAVRVQHLSRNELATILGLDLSAPLLLVTYHPTTLSRIPPADAADALLDALDGFPSTAVVFTGVNADPGGDAIATRFKAYVQRQRHRAVWRESLGQTVYLSLLREAAAAVGNSSSGLIEAPALKVPTVNIGERQRGRLRAASVIDCAESAYAIGNAIETALAPTFCDSLRDLVAPYNAEGVSARICEVLGKFALAELTRKSFRDLPQVA